MRHVAAMACLINGMHEGLWLLNLSQKHVGCSLKLVVYQDTSKTDVSLVFVQNKSGTIAYRSGFVSALLSGLSSVCIFAEVLLREDRALWLNCVYEFANVHMFAIGFELEQQNVILFAEVNYDNRKWSLAGV